MIKENERTCPKCYGNLRYYDKVKRNVKEGNGKKKYISLRRYKCQGCNSIHRELIDCIYPFKQYSIDVIEGVLEGFITPSTYGYEDYPCELTMSRWLHNLNINTLHESLF